MHCPEADTSWPCCRSGRRQFAVDFGVYLSEVQRWLPCDSRVHRLPLVRDCEGRDGAGRPGRRLTGCPGGDGGVWTRVGAVGWRGRNKIPWTMGQGLPATLCLALTTGLTWQKGNSNYL